MIAKNNLLKLENPTKVIINSKQSLIHAQKNLKCKPKNTLTKVKIPFDPDEGKIILDSPHRRSLLKNGLNKYDLLYLIGKGTFGSVIKGQYKGDIVAFKLVKLEKPGQQLNENNALVLVHKNIIKILNIINSERYGLVIMEYYKNSKNLQQVLDDNNIILNKDIIIGFIKDVTNGLDYCHSNDVLHLDIKPKNILLCNNDICKICDFGNSVKEPVSTQKFKHQGTVAYTAPEILKGDKPSSKCDIYSLGILIWQLVFRKTPYESLDSEVVIYKVVKFNFRPSLDIKDRELSTLCSLCWQTDPNLRPTASHISDMLKIIS